MAEYERTYLGVVAEHSPEGTIKPLEIKLQDGRRYAIDKVDRVEQAFARKAGGQGIRYTVRIRGAEKVLFLDQNRWFAETKMVR